MICETGQIKCDRCGKFIAFKDIHKNNAYHRMFTPDSHISEEVYISYCKKCNSAMKKQGGNK